jgi:hypothetical protein
MTLLTEEQINGRAPVQVAFIVDDLERAAQQWAKIHGAGPFFLLDDVAVTDVRGPDGEPGVLKQGIAVGQWGPLMVELVRQDRVEPPRAAELLTAPGFSHIAYFSTDSEADAERLESSGAPVILSLNFGGVPVRFHDARKTSGFVIEHYAFVEGVEETYRKVATAAEDWDGSAPVRPF